MLRLMHEDMVYQFAQESVEFVQHEIYSTKSGDFLIFIANFAMSFNFLLLLKCTTKVSEIFDMTKS